VSRGTALWLKLKMTSSGYFHYGRTDLKASGVLHGSSLAYDGLDWNRIAEVTDGAIESWATAGSSPSEWELLHRRSSHVLRTFVVISPFDLNEYFLSDFRADIVPLVQTIRDLKECGADWELSKMILRQYPLKYIRILFPTAGRSDGVMVGIRSLLMKSARASGIDAGDGPKFGGTSDIVEQKVSDWSTGRLQRRLAGMEVSSHGKHSFSGLKKMALERLLRQAGQQGEVFVIVMPLPPVYKNEFLTPGIAQDFEEAMLSIERRFPRVRMIRLDYISAFDSNDLFWDIVHLNRDGQKIATEALLKEMQGSAG